MNDIRRNLIWTPDEDQRLREAFLQGKTPVELKELHGRSLGAIKSRLLHLGLVTPRRRPSTQNIN